MAKIAVGGIKCPKTYALTMFLLNVTVKEENRKL